MYESTCVRSGRSGYRSW